MMLNAEAILDKTHRSAVEASAPISVARYFVEVLMNEENPSPTANHVEAFRKEFQRALDDGYFSCLRYDTLVFEVDRQLLDIFVPKGKT